MWLNLEAGKKTFVRKGSFPLLNLSRRSHPDEDGTQTPFSQTFFCTFLFDFAKRKVPPCFLYLLSTPLYLLFLTPTLELFFSFYLTL